MAKQDEVEPDYTVTDLETRLRDEKLQPPQQLDVHRERGRAAFRRQLRTGRDA